MFAIDFLLLVMTLLFAPLAGRLHLRKSDYSLVRLWDRLAARRRLAVLFIGACAFVGSALLSWAIGFREPAAHDEFSYLLGADTFARGRWTNPTHPLWEHFDTFHVLQKPSYQSKYPPAQSLLLAVGIWLGHPLIGVWLGMGLCCGAICWMLQAWVPPRWALLGAWFAMIRLVFFAGPLLTPLYWSQTYWGGGAAAFGGALVFGAARRLVGRVSSGDSILLAVGLLILANSRPYEGLVVSLPVAALLLRWLLGASRPAVGVLVRRFLLPLALILLPGFAVMGYYHYRVTGSALRMPALAHQEQYDVAPKFYWQSVRPEPAYVAPELKKLHVDMEYKFLYAESSYINNAYVGTRDILRFFVGFHLWLPLLFLPCVLHDPWMKFAAMAFGLGFAALILEIAFFPHYAAPLTGLIYLLLIQSYRRLRLCRRSTSHYGRGVARLLPIAALISCTCFLTIGPRFFPKQWQEHLDPDSPNRLRARIIKELQSKRGKHLITVRYGPNRTETLEWVANEAEIDNADVVWARELDAARNRRLLEYFSDRRVWLLEADKRPLVLKPYPNAASRERPLP